MSPVDRRRARQRRQGKADLRYESAIARTAGKYELRCPKCGTRSVKALYEREGSIIFACTKKDHRWTSVRDEQAFRSTFPQRTLTN